ncbi:MAG: hypothetical protein ACJ0DI_07365 [bacterium]
MMGENANQIKSVSFTRMEDGTAEEYAFLTPLYEKCRNGVSDPLLELLKSMKGDKLGYQVDRYTHSLQSATRAESDGSDEETVRYYLDSFFFKDNSYNLLCMRGSNNMR